MTTGSGQWRVRNKMLLILWLIFLISYLDRVNFSVALPAISNELGLTAGEKGLVLSAFFIGYGLLQIGAGLMVDRFGGRVTMTLALFWWSLFTAFTGMVGGFIGLLLVRPLFGAGEAMHPPASWKLISQWFPKKEQVRANSLNLCSIALGPAFAPLLVVLLMQWVGWRGVFYIFAIPGFIVTRLCWKYMRDKPEDHPDVTPQELAEIREGQTASDTVALSKEEKRLALAAAVREPGLWMLMGTYLLFGIAFWGFLSWLPSYLVDVRQFAMVKMGLVASIPFFASFVAMLIASWVCNHLFGGRKQIFVATCYLLGALFMWQAFAAADPNMCVLWLTLTAAFGIFMPFGVFWAISMEVLPTKVMGFASGFINTGGQIGGFIAPIAIGYLIQYYQGSYAAGFGLMVGCLIAAAILVLTIRPRKAATSESH